MEQSALARHHSRPLCPPASTHSGDTSQSHAHTLKQLQIQVCVELLQVNKGREKYRGRKEGKRSVPVTTSRQTGPLTR